VNSAIKVDKDLPLEKLCLLGCGVGTGWARRSTLPKSAERHRDHHGHWRRRHQRRPGGGARRGDERNRGRPGCLQTRKGSRARATHVFVDIADADAFAKSVTNGQGAHSAIVTIGVVHGEHVAQAFNAIRKGGTVVVTGVTPVSEVGIPISLACSR